MRGSTLILTIPVSGLSPRLPPDMVFHGENDMILVCKACLHHLHILFRRGKR